MTDHDKIAKLYTVLFENGFSKNMEQQAEALVGIQTDLSDLKGKFDLFVATRELTCPVVKKGVQDKVTRRLVFGVLMSALSSTAAVITLLLRIGGIL